MKTKYLIIYLTISGCSCLMSYSQVYTLEECRQSAIKNNVAVKKGKNNILESEQTKKNTFTNFFPKISANGIAYNLNKPVIDIPISSVIPTLSDIELVKNGYSVGVSAVMPVFAGGRIVNGYKLSELGEEVSFYQLQQAEDQVDLTVEQYYWQLVSLRENMKTIEKMEVFLDNIIKDVSLAVEVGITNRNDLLQVRLKRNTVAGNRLKVENGIGISKMLLAQYIGAVQENFDIVYPELDELLPPVNYFTDHLSALANTTEYKLLDKNVEAAVLQKKITAGKYLPNVNIGAGYSYSDILLEKQGRGMIFAAISIPVSDWWGGSHDIKKNKLQVQTAEIGRDDTRQLLLIQMQQFYDELVEYYKQVQISRESIEQAQENLRLNKDNYQAGTSTMSDLLEAQSILQQSLDQYTTDYTNYLVKKTQYLKATGR